jgi:hypothetical protein
MAEKTRERLFGYEFAFEHPATQICVHELDLSALGGSDRTSPAISARETRATSLLQPILHAQSRHFLEIALVGGQQQGILGHRDGGDFQILGTDANFLPAQLGKEIRGLLAEGDDVSFCEKVEEFGEVFVRRDLLVNIANAI